MGHYFYWTTKNYFTAKFDEHPLCGYGVKGTICQRYVIISWYLWCCVLLYYIIFIGMYLYYYTKVTNFITCLQIYRLYVFLFNNVIHYINNNINSVIYLILTAVVFEMISSKTLYYV